MTNSTREIAQMYADRAWPAIVTSTDRTRQTAGMITAVGDDGFTVQAARGPDQRYAYDDVLEIFPANDGRGGKP